MKNKSSILFLILLWILPGSVFAQSEINRYIRKGNNLYKAKQLSKAETNYRKAMEIDSLHSRLRYNLGNTLLAEGKPKDAMKQYEEAVKLEKNPFFKAAMYHNMGVILQSQKQFGPAIECYKESLRNYSVDDRTRYNLALCQFQLKNDQSKQPQDKNNQKNEEKQDQQDQEKQQKQQQQQQQDEQQQQQQKTEMSKDNAEQMLRAAMMEEDKTQQKVRQALQNKRPRNVDKNW